MKTPTKIAAAIGLAAALASATPGFAAPVTTGVATIAKAVPSATTDVAWRGRFHGPGPALGLGVGLATGLFIGSTVAARPYGPDYYYEAAPAYAEPYVAEPYAYQPVYPAEPGYYYAPSYGYGQCYTNEGYGRRRPCDAN